MTWTLTSLTCLAHVLSLATSHGVCQGMAECGSEDDSALLQLQQAAPASRGSLQHDPPHIDCRSQPNNGTCWAQQTACELMGLMAQWQHSDNKGIAKVKEQLRDRCYNKATGTTAAVGKGKPPCFGSKYFACVTDVETYYRENPGAAYGMKAAKSGILIGLNMVRLILAGEGALPLPGAAAFSFVGTIIANFLPTTGGPPTNPCTGAKDWAECVWEQVEPLVANFVGLQIDGLFADLWKDTLNGFKLRLWKINTTASRDCPDRYPNGTVRTMPDDVRQRMFRSLAGLNDDMWGSASLFTDHEHQNKAAGLYLSMWSAFHISVMTSLLADREHRTPGDVYAAQALILCYARKVLARALRARNRRLLLVSRKYLGERPVNCGDDFHCYGEQVLYRDQAQGCHWNEVCGPQTYCDPCHRAPPCKTTQAEKAFKCHKAHVQRESDAMWEQWLAPIPGWLEMVAMMQEAEVKAGARQRAWRDRALRRASAFETDNLGTCPPLAG